MGAPDKAAAHVDGGGHNLVGREQIHGVAHAHHVGHRVQGPHLVEVDLVYRAAVGLGLGGGNGVVYRLSVGLCLLRQGQAADEGGDVAGRGVVMVVMAVVMLMVMMVLVAVVMAGTVGVLRMTVVVVMMLMVVGVDVDMPLSGGHGHVAGFLLRSAHGHLHPGARDAAGPGGQGGEGHPGQAQGIHGADKGRLVGQQLVEGGHEHIARRAHIALKIQNFHGREPPCVGLGRAGPPSG